MRVVTLIVWIALVAVVVVASRSPLRSMVSSSEQRVTFLGSSSFTLRPVGVVGGEATGVGPIGTKNLECLWSMRGGESLNQEDDDEEEEEEEESDDEDVKGDDVEDNPVVAQIDATANDVSIVETEEISVVEEDVKENSLEEDLEAEAVPLDLNKVLESAAEYTQTTVIPVTKKAFAVLVKLGSKVTSVTVQALKRAAEAAMEDGKTDGEDGVDKDDEDEDGVAGDVSVIQKFVSVVKRMVVAAFTVPDGEDGETNSSILVGEVALKTKKKIKEEKVKSTKTLDFGSYLAASYNVPDTRMDEATGVSIIGGSLTSALNEARAQARLLVVFIPVEKYKKGKESREADVTTSLLSIQVGEASNAPSSPRPPQQGTTTMTTSAKDETGSFLVWSAKVGSSEATQALKRLKAKIKTTKGSKCPILMVVYPAMVVDPVTGVTKMVPKVIAQHHCSPPPTADNMANWLGTLRKRHGKQYLAMQTVLKELQYFKERKEGYHESKKSDKERQKREQEEAKRLLIEQQAEVARLEALEVRRKDLLATLPKEATGKDAKKIAVRFADGRSGQRSFNPNQPLRDVFNWIDATYELERELVILTTMNGKQTLTWEDDVDQEKTLVDAGIDKNTGFRVSIRETKTNEQETEEES